MRILGGTAELTRNIAKSKLSAKSPPKTGPEPNLGRASPVRAPPPGWGVPLWTLPGPNASCTRRIQREFIARRGRGRPATAHLSKASEASSFGQAPRLPPEGESDTGPPRARNCGPVGLAAFPPPWRPAARPGPCGLRPLGGRRRGLGTSAPAKRARRGCARWVEAPPTCRSTPCEVDHHSDQRCALGVPRKPVSVMPSVPWSPPVPTAAWWVIGRRCGEHTCRCRCIPPACRESALIE